MQEGVVFGWKWLVVPVLIGGVGVAALARPLKAPRRSHPARVRRVQDDVGRSSRPEDVLRNRGGATVEVVFAVDTTGSMSGLIEGAKRKIWSIVSTISTAQPAPQVRIGFVAYRDKGDAYVTEVHDLTDDLDQAFSTLGTFSAGGGGDTPEHVNKALHDAVSDIHWSDRRQWSNPLYQVIFLVGDAPPHDDYGDGFDGSASIRAAWRRGITLNAIQCGDMAETTPIWQRFAGLGGGNYFAIAQSGGMETIATPYDAPIARASDLFESTTLARAGSVTQYGKTVNGLEAQEASRAASAALPAASRADRAVFNANSAQVYGSWDLTTQVMTGKLKPEAVANMKGSQLPPELKALPPAERVEMLRQKVSQRRDAQRAVADLQQQRAIYIQARMAKLGQSDKGSFDALVKATIRKQAARRGIKRQ